MRGRAANAPLRTSDEDTIIVSDVPIKLTLHAVIARASARGNLIEATKRSPRRKIEDFPPRDDKV